MTRAERISFEVEFGKVLQRLDDIEEKMDEHLTEHRGRKINVHNWFKDIAIAIVTATPFVGFNLWGIFHRS